MKRLQMTVAALAVLLAAGTASAAPADFGSWQKKLPIAFPGYTQSGTLTNFPALVVLGDNIGRTWAR